MTQTNRHVRLLVVSVTIGILGLSVGIVRAQPTTVPSGPSGEEVPNPPAATTHSVPSKPLTILRLSLADVHALFGGNNVYITGAGETWVQAVKPESGKMAESRHRLTLKPEEVKAIAKTIADSGYMESKDSTRAGMPDEARPVIRLDLADGRTKQTSRWERDRDEGVDAVRQIFRNLIKRATAEKPESTAPYDPKWRPAGW